MDIKMLEEATKKAIAYLKDEYAQFKAGRANPKILDKVDVDYYGTPTPIKQIASISVPEPRIIQIQPYDINSLKDIERAIQAANIGINPSSDGKVIRLIIPMLTEETRVELTKDAKKLAEETKVSVRNSRRDSMDYYKKQEKDSEITEDDLKKFEKDIQKIVDDAITEIDSISDDKCKEIMEV